MLRMLLSAEIEWMWKQNVMAQREDSHRHVGERTKDTTSSMRYDSWSDKKKSSPRLLPTQPRSLNKCRLILYFTEKFMFNVKPAVLLDCDCFQLSEKLIN
jgi:hypothetical protein